MRTRVEGGEFDWSSLVLHNVQPLKVAIVEATSWIGAPLSATDLAHSLGDGSGLSLISYHQAQLAGLGVLEQAQARPAEGAEERRYFFPSR